MPAEFLTTKGSSRRPDRAIASRLRRWKSAIPARLWVSEPTGMVVDGDGDAACCGDMVLLEQHRGAEV
jgi:hypothetical protein